MLKPGWSRPGNRVWHQSTGAMQNRRIVVCKIWPIREFALVESMHWDHRAPELLWLELEWDPSQDRICSEQTAHRAGFCGHPIHHNQNQKSKNQYQHDLERVSWNRNSERWRQGSCNRRSWRDGRQRTISCPSSVLCFNPILSMKIWTYNCDFLLQFFEIFSPLFFCLFGRHFERICTSKDGPDVQEDQSKMRLQIKNWETIHAIHNPWHECRHRGQRDKISKLRSRRVFHTSLFERVTNFLTDKHSHARSHTRSGRSRKTVVHRFTGTSYTGELIAKFLWWRRWS